MSAIYMLCMQVNGYSQLLQKRQIFNFLTCMWQV